MTQLTDRDLFELAAPLRQVDAVTRPVDAQRRSAWIPEMVRLAGVAVGIFLLVAVVLLVAQHHPQRKPANSPNPAPHPCTVGSPGCGPLPTVPWDHTPRPSHAPDRGALHHGLLRPGAYTDVNWHHMHLSITVPAGWSWNGRTLSKGSAAVSFYTPPVLVYADPCHWDQPQHPLVTPALASGDVILSELAAQPMRYATPPQGLPADALALRLTVPSNLDVSKCDHDQYRTWGTGGNTLLAHGPGQRDLIWIQYLGFATGKTLIIDATTFPTTPTRLVHQVDAILAKLNGCVQCD
jgi:hypothetical protein